MQPFDRLESQVRSYCRAFPTVFSTSSGCHLTDASGRTYLDFFSGAGALNYGHNPPDIRDALVAYLAGDGITHSLDMMTEAKARFLEAIERRVLHPRGLDYRVLTPGPTGTNAVEAALKMARKATGRTQVIGFTNGFHGMTLGALAITGNTTKRAGAGVPLSHATSLPYDGEFGEDRDTLEWLEHVLQNPSSGLDKPAAVVLECVQGEGGARAASAEWIRGVREITRRHGVLMIVDDIQAGCGRTGEFFSFEFAGVVPDMITLSKSLSGMGLPLSIVLVKPEWDVFSPGEHNGTFRGFNPAFVTATTALERYWSDDRLSRHVRARSAQARKSLERLGRAHGAEVTGRGLMLGLRFEEVDVAKRVAEACFTRGLVIETAGAHDEVLKLLPPLVITHEELDEGLTLIADAVREVAGPRQTPSCATSEVTL